MRKSVKMSLKVIAMNKRCLDFNLSFLGFLTVEKCDEWPVQKCTTRKETVLKYTPETSCNPEPRELCYPSECQLVQVFKDKICVFDEILKTFTSSQFICILSGNPLSQQDQDCDRQRA